LSTHSNPNTKENIANVHGAKTLLALIPLDLKFELDASNRPGSTQSARNWSTQEDSGSREVKIVGHISRPVVGEGRQTPDRQMLFVNSRPCALPQVTKAFNDVYKMYNITQSPFIFADFKLDTNAYDVNVSPDKRTIMLHDQTALLESLKNALTTLFEGHDQSVPQAQLIDRKLPSFKPPTIAARPSTGSVMERHNESVPADNTDQESQSDTEASKPPTLPEEGAPRGFIKASLIERFAGRETEARKLLPPTKRPTSIAPDEQDAPTNKRQQEDVISTENEPERELSPLFEPEDQRQPSELPRAVQDFNARLASQQSKRTAHKPSLQSARPDENQEEYERISVIQTPQKRPSQSSIQNAFDRMRPMRTPVQQATITVGDTTTVSTIGSNSRASKRARIHTPKFSLNGTPLSQTPKKPLLMGHLRGFAAPGTQIVGSDEEDGDEEDDVEPESSMPNPKARMTLPQKRTISKELIVPSTDELYGMSSTPPPMPPPLPAQESEVEEDGDEDAQVEGPTEDDDVDNDYIDESEKKVKEEARVAQMIAEAEEAVARPTEMNIKRASKLFKASGKKYSTIDLVKFVDTSSDAILHHARHLQTALGETETLLVNEDAPQNAQLNAADPEERLSLTVTKSDFHNMRIIGQFNLGFILAVRPPSKTSSTSDLFIIDQHASDEKYNFERLSATTVVVSQRLVHPYPLELTAVDEEIMLNNEHAMTANGFVVSIDTSGDVPVGQRAKLTSLPMSKEVTFTPTDLEELLSLLHENAPSMSGSLYVPRPSKVRKLLASRACRSSIMIGKTLRAAQMEKVVRHMGEMDKPWSCPHGRPTMRHLFGLEKWEGWREGGGVAGLGEVEEKTDWARYLAR
jgi:DNA mismatch repair protein PMS2